MRSTMTAGILVMAVATLWAAGAAAQEGDRVFRRQCGTCHAIQPGKNGIGPSLAGVAGKPAGGVAGFDYSDALKKSGLTWTDATLDKYLADPKAVVPDGKMVYAGLKDDDDRKAVIDYLKTLK